MINLFNDNWQFKLFEIGEDFNGTNFQTGWSDVEIPHDWLIYDSNNLYKTGEGRYRKRFTPDNTNSGDVVSLIFDGVYMDCVVYVNRKKAGEWKYGYTSFCVEITPYLTTGENEILVCVRHEAPNTRWYSGAGIYRNVRINYQRKTRILNDGVYIHTEKKNGSWVLETSTETEGEYSEIRETLFDMGGNIADRGEVLKNPVLWDISAPYFYTLKTELIKDGEIVDEVINPVGFRITEYSPQNGFFLNGKNLKLHGVCLHHDCGALGAAFNINAAQRQLELMQDMGVNAVRISHNPPAREFLDLCDKMGMMVIDEIFDIWEHPKNKNDYARFFPEWHKKDVASWVKRDRNHPSVIMFSIGNEIYDTHKDERGLELAKILSEETKKHDPSGNAAVTIASNFMPFPNAQKVADYIKLAGYNYAENIYDLHHCEHDDWFIYGSETASAVRSRGVYHFPIDAPVLTSEDMQCSDLGNSVVGWGAAAEKAWIDDRDRAYCGGQFIWTGMDYIGEPTPYPTKSSYFGAVDTAGIPKAIFYFYKSVWDKSAEPFIKLFPHWDWNNGQLIDVIAYSNVSEAELFLNEKSLGRQSVDFEKGQKLHFEWRVAFEQGELLINAYDKNGKIIASDKKITFGEPEKIALKYDNKPVFANNTDLIYVNASVIDKNGIPVENARNRIFVKTGGCIYTAGIDNGDSTDYDSYKGNNKRLFSGQLTVILKTCMEAGKAFAEFTSSGLKGIRIDFNVLDGYSEKISFSETEIEAAVNKELPLRKIELNADSLLINTENKTAQVTASLFPKNADYRDITWKCVLDTGAETDAAEIKISENKLIADIKPKGDGRFKIRAVSKNGKGHTDIMSELNFTAEGLGEAYKNPFAFILASRYDISAVPLKIIEKGAVAGVNKTRTTVGFKNLDFGKVKTDILRLFIGTTSYFDEIPTEVWIGDPDKDGSRQIDLVSFPRNNLHYDFEPLDFKLAEKLSGIVDISFVFDRRCVFGGFMFVDNRAFEKINIAERDEIYGDDFKIRENERRIENIGNNVIITFNSLNFNEKGAEKLIISGFAAKGNSITMRVKQGVEETSNMLEFTACKGYSEQCFNIKKISGIADISFVFLPGSDFNFEWFKFE